MIHYQLQQSATPTAGSVFVVMDVDGWTQRYQLQQSSKMDGDYSFRMLLRPFVPVQFKVSAFETHSCFCCSIFSIVQIV
jgi:hypothetical protein